MGRSRMARRLVWGSLALGASMLAAWCVEFSGAPWRTALLAIVLLLAAGAAWKAARLGEGVRLHWDGMHWSCDGAQRVDRAVATVHLDLQTLMLVRLCGAGRAAVWLWIERSSAPQCWLDLRRALCAAAPRGIGASVSPQP